jgi:hypothetical protein
MVINEESSRRPRHTKGCSVKEEEEEEEEERRKGINFVTKVHMLPCTKTFALWKKKRGNIFKISLTINK